MKARRLRLALLLGTAVLAACADGYGNEEPLVLDDRVSLPRAIEVMNLTDREVRDVRGARVQRFTIDGDCRLRVMAEDGGTAPMLLEPLSTLAVEIDGAATAGRFETWVRARGEERVRVLPSAPWTEATQLRWLIEHAARICPADTRRTP